jgi:hypothetical protein
MDLKLDRIILLLFFLQPALADVYLKQDNCLLCIKNYFLVFSSQKVSCCAQTVRKENAQWIRKKQPDGSYLLQNKETMEYLNSYYNVFTRKTKLRTTASLNRAGIYWNFNAMDEGYQIENSDGGRKNRYLNKNRLNLQPGLWKVGRLIGSDIEWDSSHTTTETTEAPEKSTVSPIPTSLNPTIKPIEISSTQPAQNMTSEPEHGKHEAGNLYYLDQAV